MLFYVEMCFSKLHCLVLGQVIKISYNHNEVLIVKCVKTFPFQT